MPRRAILVLAGLALFGGCGTNDPGEPGATLQGAWSLMSYADHGVTASTTGTASFETNGSFTILGEITFPGEPVDSLQVSGTWSMRGDRATLVTSEGSGEWAVSFSGTEATLSLVGPSPTNSMHLHRRSL